jgi:hypothetical protein
LLAGTLQRSKDGTASHRKCSEESALMSKGKNLGIAGAVCDVSPSVIISGFMR